MTLYANINHNRPTDLISVLKLYTVVMLKMDTDAGADWPTGKPGNFPVGPLTRGPAHLN